MIWSKGSMEKKRLVYIYINGRISAQIWNGPQSSQIDGYETILRKERRILKEIDIPDFHSHLSIDNLSFMYPYKEKQHEH
jgi:hypothetical protein